MTPTAVVFGYTQTGQLTEAERALTDPLAEAGWQIRRVAVAPGRPYPFPWSLRQFFGIFPECVDESARVGVTLDPAESDTGPADLVIFAYQVWYLAPSLPMRSLLADRPDLFADRDVVTMAVCRNMWYSAALEVHRHLTTLGARHRGMVAVTDTRPQAVTLVTTLRWLLTGRRDGRFGRAGVGAAELERVGELGRRVAALADPTPDAVALLLDEARAAPVMPVLAAGDLVAGRLFRAWAAMMRRVAPSGGPVRAALVVVFVTLLGKGIAFGLPALTLARLVARRRFDAAVRVRLRPLRDIEIEAGMAA